MRPSPLHFVLIAASPFVAVPIADAAPPDPPQPFDIAEIHVEKNATDDDTEISSSGGGERTGHPNLRTRRRLDPFAASQSAGVNASCDRIYRDVGRRIRPVWRAYTVPGRNCEGGGSARSTLARLPAATVSLRLADSEVDPDNGVVIEWSAVPGVTEYIVELENESADPEQSLSLNLPPDATHFEVPASWLRGGAEYQVGVATVAPNGNVVFAEIQFTTAE